ncbi:MAG: hypothetical protein JO033_04520 [Acidobacteriaceae bacterium]|nr:hypothetical protein [Acidobacteriaceae bacterium]
MRTNATRISLIAALELKLCRGIYRRGTGPAEAFMFFDERHSRSRMMGTNGGAPRLEKPARHTASV